MFLIGKDKLHQLALIRELRGNIEWPGMHNLPYYPEFQSYKSIDLQPKYFITDYKIRIHEPLAINFINGLLTLDPQQRLNVNTAVKSEFLQAKPSSDVFKSLLSNYSNEASHYPIRNMPNVPHDTIY
jgi:serine/threonine protein kinase